MIFRWRVFISQIREMIAHWKFQEADRLSRRAEELMHRAVKLRVEANRLMK